MTRTNATAVRAIFVSPASPKISMSPLELDGYLTGNPGHKRAQDFLPQLRQQDDFPGHELFALLVDLPDRFQDRLGAG